MKKKTTMDQNQETVAAPIAKRAKVGDVVRFLAGEKADPCPALVVAIGTDDTADLKVLPNAHPNPARDRAPIQLVTGAAFSEKPASGCWSL